MVGAQLRQRASSPVVQTCVVLARPGQLTIAKQAFEQALQASAHRTQWSCG